MAAKGPNSALVVDGEIGIGRLARRSHITVACRDGCIAWRRSADPGFARSGTSGPPLLAPCNLSCSRCSMHVCEHQMSRSTAASHRICNEACDHLNHCVRLVNDLPRRGAMDQGRLRRFSSQLASSARARAARAKPADRPSTETHSPSPPNVKWTTLCTYTNSWVRPMRRRGRGGGGWEVVV